MGRDADGNWTPGWTPPRYEVDENGKVVDYVNHRAPNNWGRWGEFDEVGTVNFITPGKVLEAAGLIREGAVFSLAVPLNDRGPLHPSRPGIQHFHHATGSDLVVGSDASARYPRFQPTDDLLFMPVQGSTQWDAIAHVGYDDTLFNGFWIGTATSDGAKRGSIDQLTDRVVSRGVLLDLARHVGQDRLSPGFAIEGDLLDDCAEASGVTVRTGDILLIRTGHLAWYYELRDSKTFWRSGAPGLSIRTAEWLYEHEVAAVAVDNIAVEVEPFEEPYEHVYPLHARLIRDLGLTLGEVWWLEELARACAEDGRWEFFLAAPPLNLTGGSGSMLNPLAIR